MIEIRNKIMSLFGRRGQETQIGKIVPISLADYLNIEPKKGIRIPREWLFSRLFIPVWLAIAYVIYSVYSNMGIVGIISIIAIGGIGIYFIKNKVSKKKVLPVYSKALLGFVYDNKLYEKNSEGRIVSEIDMYYAEYTDMFSVFVRKKGDVYQKHAGTIGELLESRLGMNLVDIKENSISCEYIFKYDKAERKKVQTMPKEDANLSISIYDDFKLNLRGNFSFLISGASGAGKSYLTYYMLTSFISKTVNDNHSNAKHAVLYCIDPKQADLLKICKISGMPTSNYGSSVADAFKIVKTYLAELERRMTAYENSSLFNAVGVDLGMVPALLIIEEYSSLVASMNSKQKTEFENLVAIIAQKGRSLSMGLWVVMQQPRADSLGSNIKEQLLAGGAVFLGNPTNVAAQMMFDSTDIPKVTGKGVGIYSEERSQPKVFESPIFENDVFETILPVWKHVAESYEKEELSEMSEETEELAMIADGEWNDCL